MMKGFVKLNVYARNYNVFCVSISSQYTVSGFKIENYTVLKNLESSPMAVAIDEIETVSLCKVKYLDETVARLFKKDDRFFVEKLDGSKCKSENEAEGLFKEIEVYHIVLKHGVKTGLGLNGVSYSQTLVVVKDEASDKLW